MRWRYFDLCRAAIAMLSILVAVGSHWHLASTATAAGFGMLPVGGVTASSPSNTTALRGHLVQFSDATRAAGINFVHFKGNNGTPTILEETGPGVCVSDYDRDGYPDIYFVNGRDLYQRGIHAHNALYHNNGDGTFTDVTDRAGVPGTAYGLGCVWGDCDNERIS